jgi:glycosyltransferase involved in cell wall biosynthesis
MKPHAVLVPTYNSAATVEETLQSLLAQDLSSVDAVYLADDASADATVAIARRVWQSATPLIVIEQPRNQGQWRNVNAAMRQMPAHLDWVCLLHSDDVAKPHWLTEMVGQMGRTIQHVASICSSWDNLNGDGSVVPGEDDPSKPAVHIDGSSESVRNTLRNGCWWHISGCAIRMAAYREVGEFVEYLPQVGDWEWLLRCLRSGWAVDYIPQTLIVYRQHGASVSSTSFRDHRDVSESLDVIKTYAPYLSTLDVCRLHAARSWVLLRRTGKSLLQGNPTRARKAVVLLGGIPTRVGASLTSKHVTGAARATEHHERPGR